METERLRSRPATVSIATHHERATPEAELDLGQAIVLADDCAKAGLVSHDAEGKTAERLPHSVMLVNPSVASLRNRSPSAPKGRRSMTKRP
jgi:hypothetical protein